MGTETRDTTKAFLWIAGVLKEAGIYFRISGGFAARLYGAQRELADIDIELAASSFAPILEAVSPFIIFGPARYLDQEFDLPLLTLQYEGQEIDLVLHGQSKIFDRPTGKWIELCIDFSDDNSFEVFGLQVPVISKADLIEYKRRLQREADLEDLRFLTGGQCT
jgi:hypothetical protein